MLPPELAKHVPVVRLVGVTVGLVVLAVQLVYWLPNHATRDASDLDVPGYFRVATHVMAREPLYEEGIRHVPGTMAAYIYPPPFAVLIAPLSRLGPGTFQVVWYVGVLISFWAYAAALVRLAGRSLRVGRVLLAGAILQLFPGTSVTMSFGNADLLIWSLCALALKPRGAWLAGVAASFKVFPVWILVTKRRKDCLIGAALGAAILAASLIVVGLKGFLDWIRVVGVLASGVDWPTNVSFPHLIGYSGKVLLFSIFVGAPLTAWLLRKHSEELAGAAVLLVAAFLSPICWWHYAPMLLMPCAALIREGRSARLGMARVRRRAARAP